ncbi:hypothetical protein [Natronococcus jeotgali]|uniref:hypothetical protein n=1 Tax=Natronococcus jeotgali TaxID=413812 RepID=UPI0012684D81|nr:hypothetical protein [Natronococcus jeotgali]
MEEKRVLQVASVENDHLLLFDEGEIIRVENRISGLVTAGDYVETTSYPSGEVATEVVKTGVPDGKPAAVEVVADDKITVISSTGRQVLPKPNDDITAGEGVFLTELGEIYEVIDKNLINVIRDEQNGDYEGDHSNPSDYEEQNLPENEYDDFVGPSNVLDEVRTKVEIPLKEPEI